jgi:hypothetical protein
MTEFYEVRLIRILGSAAGQEEIVERVFSEEMARRLLQAMNEQQATGRTDVDVFPAAVAAEVGSGLQSS